MADIPADTREDASLTEAQILAGNTKSGQSFHASDTKRNIFWSNVDSKYYRDDIAEWSGSEWVAVAPALYASLRLSSFAGSGELNLGVDNDGNLINLDFPEDDVIEISVDTAAVSNTTYLVATTAGAVTVTLPAVLVGGFNVRVYKATDINTQEVTIDGNGILIGSDATQEIVGESEGISIISDGKYFIVQDNRGGLQRKLSQSTGILSGFAVTTNANNTSIDIGAGIYVIEDATDMLNPVSRELQFDGQIGYPISNLSTEGITFVYIDADKVLSQQTNVTTSPDQWRTMARFATVQHFFGTGTVEATLEYATPPQNPSSRLSTFMNTLGIIRDGVIISGSSGDDLYLANTSGTLVSPGSNQVTSSLNPDNVPVVAHDPIAALVYLTRNDVLRLDTGAAAIVDVANYDVGGVVTAIAGNSTTSVIHRVYIGIDGTVAVQYGQNTYGTLTLAKDALFSGEDTFVENPILKDITTLLCYIISTKSAVDLNDAGDALFFVTDKFGGGGTISGGGAGASTMQEAYDNSITNPEILTNDSRLALDIRNGSASDTNSVFTVQNIAGTKILDVTGEGALIKGAVSTNDATEILALGGTAFQTADSAIAQTLFDLTAGATVTITAQDSFATPLRVSLGRSFTNSAAVASGVAIVTLPTAYWPSKNTYATIANINSVTTQYNVFVSSATGIITSYGGPLPIGDWRMTIQYDRF